MFIAHNSYDYSSSVGAAYFTFRSYGAGVLNAIVFYKHFVPTALISKYVQSTI
jgi:hypothetical protein